jgi:hypothetical protein
MRTLALALAMVLSLAAAAEARTWRGETEQGRSVSVRTGDDGEVEQVRVNWKARCEKGTYRSRTIFDRPFDVSERTAFEDAGTVRVNVGDGYRARHRVYVRGTLDDDRWTGTFRVRTRVTKDGRFVDRCRLEGVSWTAEPVR